MAKINLTPDEFGDIVVSFLLDKLLHSEEVIPNNEEFNEYAEMLARKGVKPLSLNYYLKMKGNKRVYYKRIRKVFEYKQGQSAVIQIWPSEDDLKKASKKGNIVKRAVKKLLRRENINREEENLLLEELEEVENEG